MKTPKFLSKLSAVLASRPKKRLQATARAARPTMEDYDAEEPTTKLSSAFIVVLILHVVAVGGIYAFNSIKASRRDREIAAQSLEPTPPVVAKSQPPASALAAPVAPIRAGEPVAPVPAIAKSAAPRQHVVEAGQNLTKIALAFKVTPAEIMAANQLKEGATLRPGQTLTIPTPKPAAAEPAKLASSAASAKSADIPPTKTTPGLHTVKKGDTLISIARSYGMSMQDLSKANKITDPKKLQLGQVLKVPPRKS